MSVNEPNGLTTFINVAATPADKQLLELLARQDGNMSQSAMVRRLIRQEAARRGAVAPDADAAPLPKV